MFGKHYFVLLAIIHYKSSNFIKKKQKLIPKYFLYTNKKLPNNNNLIHATKTTKQSMLKNTKMLLILPTINPIHPRPFEILCNKVETKLKYLTKSS